MLFHRSIPARAAAVALIAGGGLAAPTFFASAASAADAPCTATAAGGTATTASSCDTTGTLTLQGGALSGTFPAALAWTGSITGTDQQIVDATDTTIGVDDLTGSGAGWHLTAYASTFTTGGTTVHKLADTGTLKVNGSLTNDQSTSGPGAACAGSDACTVPTPNLSSYPVKITTAASPTAENAVSIYSAKNDTGIGKTKITNLGWWIHVPANAYAGTYTSTITVAVVSAP